MHTSSHTSCIRFTSLICLNNIKLTSNSLKVLIFPSQRSGSSLSSANVWMHLVGSHGETDYLQVPRGIIHFSFWARNLGHITSLRIGHDNAGLTPNWMVEHVVVKNEFTGHCYKFGCGRWLGKSIDDGSIERYLVGSMVPGIPNCQVMMPTLCEHFLIYLYPGDTRPHQGVCLSPIHIMSRSEYQVSGSHAGGY